MKKTFQPADIESKWYQHWEQQGHFAPSGQGPPYCIMLPPPNVTGSLHMGHGFQQTLMDVLIRYYRMKGYNTLWQAGTDHAGIATQMVVERQLDAQGQTRHQLGRAAFIDKIWDWRQHSGDTINQQMRRLGDSIDWSRERFTMDEGLSHAAMEAFVRLFNEGLIYRGQRLVNWDPVLRTAISDLEVIATEEQGSLWHIRYPLANGSGELVVATTRPETLLGDAAVAVHPKDERYQALIGQRVKLPLTDRNIPIIADEYVDPAFGSGCVKITPAHDFNDYEVGQRHNLPLINLFHDDASLNDQAPAAYQGLDRLAARKKMLTDLNALGLLKKTEDHVLKVPRGDRSNAIIEPYLTQQWYVDTKKLAEPAIKAVETGAIEFVPKTYENMYFAWMRDIQPWCISRQLWWGHRIPAWYDEYGNVYVAHSEDEVRSQYSLDDRPLRQDEDVLDTWFSSALWTFSTLGWPEQTTELATFHPTNVLITGFDIIFFWVARMIMMTLHLKGEIPFKQVYVTGLIRDHEGQKMSKSKGNVIDPIDLIDGISLEGLLAKRTRGMMQPQLAEKITQATRQQFPEGIKAYGTDALRYTYCSLASTGRDIQFDVGRIEGYHHFCNKLWNAARFVLSHAQDHNGSQPSNAGDAADRWPSDQRLPNQWLPNQWLPNQWIISRLQHTIAAVSTTLEHYRFDHASQILYDFFWNEYCDWYLELVKPMLWNENHTAEQSETRHTLAHVLETILRLLHPLMPYITEEIWQSIAPLAHNTKLNHTDRTIMLQAYPTSNKQAINPAAEDTISWLQRVIVALRTIRSELTIPPNKPIELLLNNGTTEDKQRLEKHQPLLRTLAKVANIRWLANHEEPPPAATAVVNHMTLLVPLADLIDKDAEIQRLNKAIHKAQAELAKLNGKLNNSSFINKAPEAIVSKERAKATHIIQKVDQLKQQLEAINNLGCNDSPSQFITQ